MTHWYTHEGERAYQVPYADPSKGMRDATLTDARKLGLVPGVTDVLRSMAAPGLVRWKVQEAIKATQDVFRVNYDSERTWIADVEIKARQDSERKAALGTAIHMLIEHAVRDGGVCTAPEDWPGVDVHTLIPNVLGVLEELGCQQLFSAAPDDPWKTEATFGYSLDGLRYGGCADLVRGNILVDVKTKEVLDPNVAVYDEHLAQAALYSQAFGTGRSFNLFVGYDGQVKLVEHSAAQKARGLRIGRAALALWYAVNNLQGVSE